MPETPRVTIGIPTYNRPTLLRRALTSVAQQDYPNLEVVVSDNCTPSGAVQDVVAELQDRIDQLVLVRQPENIGVRANLFFLLNRAEGKYFMWLADDDEISPNFVSSLVGLLEADTRAVTAAGNWRLMISDSKLIDMPTASFPQDSAVSRVWRFVWHSDDAFYYGLHRLAALKQAAFKPFWWPNRHRIRNWAYLYLLDMVISGKILLAPDPSVRFINHDYTTKEYLSADSLIVDLFRAFVRRINLHYLYIEKIARRCGFVTALVLLPVSIASLIADGGRTSVRLVAGVGRRFRRKLAGKNPGAPEFPSS